MVSGQATNTVKALLSEGQSVWQDDLSRQMLQSGELKHRVAEIGIRGVTSNPTIFQKAIAAGTAYDDYIRDLLSAGRGAGEIFEAVAVADVRNACDLLRPLYEESDGADGFVSIEVSPALARDTQRTLVEARRLWSSVDRPNLMVKVPGTDEGAPAVEALLEEGLNINITLLFSLDHYERVATAYVSALEKRQAAGKPVDRIASVASFFVSRVDTLVDKKLDEQIANTDNPTKREKLENLKGKAAIANARLAYEKFQAIFDGPRFAPLRQSGAHVQRPLWASTGTKNPAYSDVLYIETLIGPYTVNTMPIQTLEAFLDHGTVERTLDQDFAGAHEVMDNLAAVGISMQAVTDQLEKEGIAAFATSYDDLLSGVEGKREELAQTVGAT